jgi:hypothetical protein
MDEATEIRSAALRAAMDLAANDYMPASASYTIVYTGPALSKVDTVLADARKIEAYLLGHGGDPNVKPAPADKPVDHMAAVREMARP